MEHYEEGLMAADSLLTLKNSINEALDRADTELYDWTFLHALTISGCMFKLGLRWQKAPCIGRLIHKWVYYDVAHIYDIF